MSSTPNYTPQDEHGCIFCGKKDPHVFEECEEAVRVRVPPTTPHEKLVHRAYLLGVFIRGGE